MKLVCFNYLHSEKEFLNGYLQQFSFPVISNLPLRVSECRIPKIALSKFTAVTVFFRFVIIMGSLTGYCKPCKLNNHLHKLGLSEATTRRRCNDGEATHIHLTCSTHAPFPKPATAKSNQTGTLNVCVPVWLPLVVIHRTF